MSDEETQGYRFHTLTGTLLWQPFSHLSLLYSHYLLRVCLSIRGMWTKLSWIYRVWTWYWGSSGNLYARTDIKVSWTWPFVNQFSYKLLHMSLTFTTNIPLNMSSLEVDSIYWRNRFKLTYTHALRPGSCHHIWFTLNVFGRERCKLFSGEKCGIKCTWPRHQV